MNVDDSVLSNMATIKKHGGYGQDGDGDGKASPWNIADAIMSTSYLLYKNGFNSNIDQAIWKYNHDTSYVAKIKQKAAEFKAAASYTDGGGGGSGSLPNSDGAGAMKPTKGRITSGYGWRNLGAGPEFHYGVDIANAAGTKIGAISPGVVTRVSTGCPPVGNLNSSCGMGWGNYIWAKHNIDGKTYEAVYAHMSGISVSLNQTLKKGQIIGAMGASGRVTGVHLHFEIHRGARNGYSTVVNPIQIIPYAD